MKNIKIEITLNEREKNKGAVDEQLKLLKVFMNSMMK